MMATLLRIGWLNLKRDRIALAFVFILPIAFFSIFGLIFGNMDFGGGGNGGPAAFEVIVIDEDQSEISGRFVDAMQNEPGLHVSLRPQSSEMAAVETSWARDAAIRRVRESDFAALILLPAGFGEDFADFSGERIAVEVVYDPSNPIAPAAIPGLLQGVAMTALPDVLMESGFSYLDQYAGGLTDEQREWIDFIRPYIAASRAVPGPGIARLPTMPGSGTSGLASPKAASKRSAGADSNADNQSTDDATPFRGLINVQTTNVRALDRGDEDEAEPSMIPYYAAGIGVMFLLFSMAGAAGSLLKEEETGTIERLLSSNITITGLLVSKWMFYGAVGFIQVVLMFVWGDLVFGGMDVFTSNHLAGLAVMTLFTAAAASAFGIMLASFCRTRGQLDGMSTIVILIMSAVGGSMVPRFVMPDFMDTVGLFTFNAHALDGYLDVFWYSRPGDSLMAVLAKIAPQLGILVGMTIVFFAIARIAARRWAAV